MSIKLKVKDHLLIPFGRPKWDIKKIRLAGVSTTGTYFESETPVVHIDRAAKKPLRLMEITEAFPEDFPETDESEEALNVINTHLKKTCNLDTEFERRFLDLYFQYCKESVEVPEYYKDKNRLQLPPPRNDFDWVFAALLPLPQAHLYLLDPLQAGFTFIPANMVRVDFVFWTGERLVAVEIDGSSHVGSEQHIRKDRMLARAGVEVIHILNSELLEFGTKVIKKLLPSEVVEFWKKDEKLFLCNPICIIPF